MVNILIVVSINSHLTYLYLTILKFLIIMRFLAVVLKIKSNKIQILTRISVEINKNRKRKIIYGSILQLSFKNILSFKNGDCLQSSPVYICKVDTPNIIENHPNFVWENKHANTEIIWNIFDKARAYN